MSASAFLHGVQHGQTRAQCLAQLSDADLRDEWQQFILKEFGTDPDVICEAFDVSKRTALYWINGEIAPRGLHVWRAIRRYNFGLDE